MLQGANLGVTKLITKAVSTPNINQMDGYGVMSAVFAGLQDRAGDGVEHRHLLVRLRRLRAYILQRTKLGNWIYAVGGNARRPGRSGCR